MCAALEMLGLFFAEAPMIVFVHTEGVDGELREDSQIFAAQYITADSMEYMLLSNYLHAWEGYQSFSDYMTGEFELAPEQ